MKPPRFAKWTFAALLLLPLSPIVLMGQKYEYNVTTSSIFGQIIISDDDQPAEQVRIELRAAGILQSTTLTGWGGEFRFADLTSGEYLISIDKLGYQPLLEKVQVGLTPEHVMLRLNRTSAPDAGGYGNIVSARELSIQPKAREALRNGIRLLQKNDLPGGLASFQYAIALFPNYYEAYYLVGVTNLMMERAQEAEKAFRQSIDLSEGHYVRSLMALGAVLCDQETFAEAESVIREGLELDDTPWIGHYSLARALFGLGRWDEAEKNAKAAMERQPDVPDTYLLLANIHIRQRNNAALLDDLEEFLKLEPDDAISAKAKKMRDDVRSTIGLGNRAASLTHP